MCLIGKPFWNASYLLIDLGNPNTIRLRRDKKGNLVDFWTDIKVVTQTMITCMTNAILTDICIANLVATQNINNCTDFTGTTTTNITTTVDNNIKGQWVINLSSTPSLSHKKLGQRSHFLFRAKMPSQRRVHYHCGRCMPQTSPQRGSGIKDRNQPFTYKGFPQTQSQQKTKVPKEFREDTPRVILTADKWMAMVMLATQDFKQDPGLTNGQGHLKTYHRDPTTKHKLIQILWVIKAQGRLSDNTYKRLYYPTNAVPPKNP